MCHENWVGLGAVYPVVSESGYVSESWKELMQNLDSVKHLDSIISAICVCVCTCVYM